MIRIRPFATVLVAASLLGATALAADAPRDRSRINGSISIAAGERAGDVETVNGSIKVGARAEVNDAETVNGGIDAGDAIRAGSLETVNGGIQVGRGAQIRGNVETVNGAIQIGPDSAVAGNVQNVNGRLLLRGARVAGNLQTVRGDVELAGGARIEGDLVVEKPSMPVNWGDKPPPRIVIGPGSSVAGRLRFEHEVELYVSERASVGPITGATPVRYGGDTPPAR